MLAGNPHEMSGDVFGICVLLFSPLRVHGKEGNLALIEGTVGSGFLRIEDFLAAFPEGAVLSVKRT